MHNNPSPKYLFTDTSSSNGCTIIEPQYRDEKKKKHHCVENVVLHLMLNGTISLSYNFVLLDKCTSDPMYGRATEKNHIKGFYQIK